MKIAKTRSTAIVGIAAVLTMLAACSSGSSGASDSTTSTSAASAASSSGNSAAAATQSSVSSPSSAPTETFEFKYAAQNPAESTYGQQAQWWIDEVGEATGGAVSFETYYNSTLAGPTELLGTVEDNRAEFAHIPAGYYPAELPLSQVAGVPFVYDNTGDNVLALYKLYDSSADLQAEYEQKHNIKVLAWAPNPNMALGMKDPVAALGDISGKKLRVVGLSAVALQAAGAEPVAMPLPEVLQALQTGVLDGWSGLPLSLATTVGVTASAPNVLDTGIGTYTAVPVIVVNLDTWNTIPADIQQVMMDKGQESVEYGLQVTQQLEQDACDNLVNAQKGSVTRISDGDLAAWKDQTQAGIIDQWVTDTAEAGIPEQSARAFFDEYASLAGTSDSTYVEGMTYCEGKTG